MDTAVHARQSAGSSSWVRHGVIGGVIAGLVFAAFEMMMALILEGAGAFFMPLRMIGGIGLGASAMEPSTPLLTAGGAGLLIHMALSVGYGIAVAGIMAAVPRLRESAATVIGVASIAGLVLWLVNFYLLAPVFGWVWFPNATNPVVQFVAHTFMYGSVLGIVLVRAMAGRPGTSNLR